MDLAIEFEQEDDGRWIADIAALPGLTVYAASREEARSKVQALALRVIHDREEIGPKMLARIARQTGLRPEDLEPCRDFVQ